MTNLEKALAVALLACSGTALAVQTPQYDVPYVGASLSFLKPDSVRDASAIGGGYAVHAGWPLEGGNAAVEVRFIDQGMRRNFDDEENYQSSLFVDYVRDFGTTVRGEGGFFSGTKFFLNGGGGVVREDSFGDPGIYWAIDAGAGLLIPLGFRGWAIRMDGRVQGEWNKDLCSDSNPNGNFCTGEKEILVDYMFQAGLQFPLTIFFQRPKPVAAAEDCPIAVVDPDSGRRDCVADSDRDGVADADDACPGTQPGTAVGKSGCAE